MASLIALLINLLVWAYLLLDGLKGYQYIITQNIEGYPNTGQTILYIVIPLIICIWTVVGVLLNRLNRYRILFGLISVLATICAIPYILVAGGGV